LDSPLLGEDRIIVTPHLGATTEEAQINVAIAVAEQILNAFKGMPVKNAVNMPYVKPETMGLIAPYLPLAEKMGRLCAQLLEGYERVEVEYSGEIAEKEVTPITIAVLKGLLQPALGASVNYVNAPVIARERKIKVVESKSKTPESYPNLITLKVRSGGEVKVIAGTIVGKESRFVQIDDYHIDVAPSGYMIVAKHLDHPNIIGPCCVILGKKGINIAGMQVGRIRAGGEAIMVLNVDSEVSEEILKEMKRVDGILDARLVYLG
jgi:D-3-phosphoglycerate dehydrogenase